MMNHITNDRIVDLINSTSNVSNGEERLRLIRALNITNDSIIPNKADLYCKDVLYKIITEGCMDKNPRPVWSDGAPAHSYSINGYCTQYNISKGEFPLITLRPVVFDKAINELLWIYKDASNDLKTLRGVYGIKWWDDWKLDDDTIGSCYGGTVKAHNLMHNLIDGIEKNPDGRRHIMCLWQEEDFKKPHGLKPCCLMTNFNVRYGNDGETYLDMALYQRSADYITAGCTVNEVQYAVLMCLVAHHFGYEPGVFTHFMNNIQIYDRHLDAAFTMIDRSSIMCKPKVVINPNKRDFFSMTPEDISIEGYPIEEIKRINPQIKLPLAV